MPLIHRRLFVQSALAAAAAGPLIVSSRSWARPGRPGPNDQIGIGVIGMGKMGRDHLGPLLKNPAVRIMAVCDVDTSRRDYSKGAVDKAYGNADCRAFIDYRELLAMPGIDAVVIGTPDHWHGIMVLDAAAAKKDIYCEKPMSLTLGEGKAMIDAVRKHNIVFQTGSQQRTEYGHKFVTACELVRDGKIGKVLTVHVGVGVSSKWCDLPEESMEAGLEWDRWLGPAPVRPYNAILSPRGVHNNYPNWRLYREYSGGMMTDWGAHHFDIAQWGLGMDTSGPVKVTPPPGENDEYGAKLTYPSGIEVIHGGVEGITFTGTSGVISVSRDRLMSIPEGVLKSGLKEGDAKLPRHPGQQANWIECIKTRQRPICDVEVGARSIACAQLCNLAYWNRRELKWDPVAWVFPGDAQANGWRDYERRKGYELPKV